MTIMTDLLFGFGRWRLKRDGSEFVIIVVVCLWICVRVCVPFRKVQGRVSEGVIVLRKAEAKAVDE